MSFIANTEEDRRKMLAAVGLSAVDELFSSLPAKHRFPKLKLPPPLSEAEVLRELEDLAGKNLAARDLFAGGGAYNHFIPAAVDAIASRGEFLTSYTPYQPEASQGTLPALFEYQSMTADLFGMDVVNASHYDGATALAEAVLMAFRSKREERRKVLLSAGIHPEYREVIAAYAEPLGLELSAPASGLGGTERFSEEEEAKALAAALDGETACVVLAFPSFFGGLADYRTLAAAAHEKGALVVVSVDPVSLALFDPPGTWGADIVTGEGQGLGNPLSFGGPYLGLFAAGKDLVRKMPGRLAGMTTDHDGCRGFVLTLSTREQHIRREKATSNICTNQGLLALRSAVYLSLLGKNGLRKVAELCFRRAHFAAELLAKLPGFGVANAEPFFKEFVLRCPVSARALTEKLGRKGIVPGIPLSRFFSGREKDLLVCVTEMNDRRSIENLAAELKAAASALSVKEPL